MLFFKVLDEGVQIRELDTAAGEIRTLERRE
jgi:hypothetical protein